MLVRLEKMPAALVQRFDDMKADVSGAIDQLARHLSIDQSSYDADEKAARWSVGEVKKRTLDSDADTYNTTTLLTATHVSSSLGGSARFRGVLSDNEVATIEDRFGDWLRARSYLA